MHETKMIVKTVKKAKKGSFLAQKKPLGAGFGVSDAQILPLPLINPHIGGPFEVGDIVTFGGVGKAKKRQGIVVYTLMAFETFNLYSVPRLKGFRFRHCLFDYRTPRWDEKSYIVLCLHKGKERYDRGLYRPNTPITLVKRTGYTGSHLKPKLTPRGLAQNHLGVVNCRNQKLIKSGFIPVVKLAERHIQFFV
jgi:hypothetical protein